MRRPERHERIIAGNPGTPVKHSERIVARLLASVLVAALGACSFSIAKPPATYKEGVDPDCSTDVVPLMLDVVLLAGLTYLMVRPSSPDGIELCTGGCKVAAGIVILSVPSFAFVRGGTRVWRCRQLQEQHKTFLLESSSPMVVIEDAPSSSPAGDVRASRQ
jgi:hypothetical protein